MYFSPVQLHSYQAGKKSAYILDIRIIFTILLLCVSTPMVSNDAIML